MTTDRAVIMRVNSEPMRCQWLARAEGLFEEEGWLWVDSKPEAFIFESHGVADKHARTLVYPAGDAHCTAALACVLSGEEKALMMPRGYQGRRERVDGMTGTGRDLALAETRNAECGTRNGKSGPDGSSGHGAQTAAASLRSPEVRARRSLAPPHVEPAEAFEQLERRGLA